MQAYLLVKERSQSEWWTGTLLDSLPKSQPRKLQVILEMRPRLTVVTWVLEERSVVIEQ